MQRIFSLGVYAPIRYIIIAVLVLPGWQIMYGQNATIIQNPGNANQQNKNVFPLSWNILFKLNTNAATRKLVIQKIQDSLTSYCKKNHPDTIPVFDSSFYCPCDSLLYNLNIRFIKGSDGDQDDGGSVSSPSGIKPVGGSGDEGAIQYISKNNPIEEMEQDVNPGPYLKKRSIKLNFFGKNFHNNSVLAVIDTGIDTTLFPLNISRLLWRSTEPERTIYNFLPHQDLQNLKDDHRSRHGTLVTALALTAYSKGITKPIYPRIMILKALDSKKTGSIFSVSCALSYARQNNATVVNASLGYYGERDSVLLHYIEQCYKNTSNPILIFAAAGNTRGTHSTDSLCDPSRSRNQLTASYTFYPASFSSRLKHVITITGLNKSGKGCYYQNYSNTVVTLGVLNIVNSQGRIPGDCCSYKAPFNDKKYEGSSFATPVACGLLMRYMLKNSFSTMRLIHEIAFQGDTPTGNIIYRGTPGVTRDGKYVVFPIINH